MAIRPVRKLAKATPALEGAGVRLRRAFGFGDPSEFDPFLLLDDFRGDRPEDYRAGFPWHPHRAALRRAPGPRGRPVAHAVSPSRRRAVRHRRPRAGHARTARGCGPDHTWRAWPLSLVSSTTSPLTFSMTFGLATLSKVQPMTRTLLMGAVGKPRR